MYMLLQAACVMTHRKALFELTRCRGENLGGLVGADDVRRTSIVDLAVPRSRDENLSLSRSGVK